MPEFKNSVFKRARAFLENFVDALFEEVQEKVNHKTLEIAREVETQLLRTFRFQEEQAAALPGYHNPATAAASYGVSTTLPPSCAPSPPPSPGQVSLGKAGDLLGDQFSGALFTDLPVFDIEELLAGCAEGFDGADSGFYSNSVSGAGGEDGFPRYENGGYSV